MSTPDHDASDSRAGLRDAACNDRVANAKDPSSARFETFRTIAVPLAKHLHANGQSTDDTIQAIGHWQSLCDMEGELVIDWERVEFLPSSTSEASAAFVCRADPTVIDLRRVSAVVTLFEKLATGRMQADDAFDALTDASRLPAHPLWLFTAAAAVGAVALAVIFGESGPMALAIIAGAAATGAIIRRLLATHGIGLFIQNFAAAFIAGITAALACATA